jgi:hypothetical protein
MSPVAAEKTVCQPQAITDSAESSVFLWLFFLTVTVLNTIESVG